MAGRPRALAMCTEVAMCTAVLCVLVPYPHPLPPPSRQSPQAPSHLTLQPGPGNTNAGTHTWREGQDIGVEGVCAPLAVAQHAARRLVARAPLVQDLRGVYIGSVLPLLASAAIWSSFSGQHSRDKSSQDGNEASASAAATGAAGDYIVMLVVGSSNKKNCYRRPSQHQTCSPVQHVRCCLRSILSNKSQCKACHTNPPLLP